jgi:hypothetical protein
MKVETLMNLPQKKRVKQAGPLIEVGMLMNLLQKKRVKQVHAAI